MKILALDTGPSTGVAMWNDGAYWGATLAREDAEDFAAAKIPYADQVITEQLVISSGTAKKGRQVQDAIEMVGLIRTLCRWHEVSLYDKSKPNEAMRFATDERLRRLGWYTPGPDHQRDATRHLVTWLAEWNLIDRTMLLSQ